MKKVLGLLFLGTVLGVGVASASVGANVSIISTNTDTNIKPISYYKKIISSGLNISLVDRPTKEITKDDLYKIKGYISENKEPVIMWEFVIQTTGGCEPLFGSKIGKYIPYFVIKDKYPDLVENHDVIYEKVTINGDGDISISGDLSDEIKAFMKENRCNTFKNLEIKLNCIEKSIQKTVKIVKKTNRILKVIYLIFAGLLLLFSLTALAASIINSDGEEFFTAFLTFGAAVMFVLLAMAT